MPKRARAEPVETYDSDGGFVSDDDGAVRKVNHSPTPNSIQWSSMFSVILFLASSKPNSK
jgi:hypothetical protein